MPTQAQTMKCVIVNDSDFDLVPTGDVLNYLIEEGSLDGGLSWPPVPIRAHSTAEFSVSTPAGAASGPSGWICYELIPLKVVAQIQWSDPVAAAGGEVFRLGQNDYDGSTHALDVGPVEVTDDGGTILDVEGVKAATVFKVKYTIRVKPDSRGAAPPEAGVATTDVAGPPGTGAGVSIPGLIDRWDHPNISQKRKKLLAVISNVFPLVFFESSADVTGSPGENHGGEKYRHMDFWKKGNKGTSCTDTNTNIGGRCVKSNGKWAFGAVDFKDAWVAWGSNPAKKMPQVGDIYVLYRDIVVKDPPDKPTDHPHLRHCGFILQVPKDPSEPWITADGGQGDPNDGGQPPRQAAYFNKRPWKLAKPGEDTGNRPVWEKVTAGHVFPVPIADIEYPYLGGGAEASGSNLSDANRLIGWLDMDSPAISFIKEAFDNPKPSVRTLFNYTEADYIDIGRRIKAM